MKYVPNMSTGASNPHTNAQVYSLPGLELLLCQELQDGLTFPWAWTSEQAQPIRASAIAPDGQLAMVRPVHARKDILSFWPACLSEGRPGRHSSSGPLLLP